MFMPIFSRRRESPFHFFTAQQSVINEDTGKLVADGAVY